MNAMKLEIHTLVGQHTWEAVVCPRDKRVLKGTWAFKLKRLPDGTAYRYKALASALEGTCKQWALIF
jgi:hypothetical protein